MRRFAALLLATAIAATACSMETVTPVEEVAEATAAPTDPPATSIPSPPTSTPTPMPEPTDPDLSATPFAMPTPTLIAPAPTADAEPTTEPTAVPPTPTLIPAPNPTVAPAPTSTPRPAPTVTPAPLPTSTPVVLPVISCWIEPQRPVTVGEVLRFSAQSSGSTLAVDFAFDHGDGTIDPRRVSDAYYAAPGTYQVQLQWEHAYGSGVEYCGDVIVKPVDAPRCLIGNGPADEFGWYCDGVWCSPNDARAICPDSVYGCHPHINGGTICIDPPPPPDVTCSISPTGPVAVGQVLTFTGSHFPPDIPVSYVFDHGDGTIDPRQVASAYYAAPGNYTVRLRWATDYTSGELVCGTVTVN